MRAWFTPCPGAAATVSSQAAAARGQSGPVTSSQPGSGADAGTTSSMDTSEWDGEKNAKYFHLIKHLFRFAQNFIDIRERESNEIPGTLDNARQMMNLHNNEAGRRVNTIRKYFISSMRAERGGK